MFADDQYELIDFGDGRRLEQFGGYLLDRPAPAAAGLTRQEPAWWQRADARFERRTAASGDWYCRRPLPDDWQVEFGLWRLLLRPTDSGAIGLFPEQAENWDWIGHQIRRAQRPVKVLNLFAYTGASTLAAAAAGAEVVHVDAQSSAVQWARRNAQHAGLQDASIRWIVEDARKFVERELRRGHSYDAAVLDPPTYGHGPRAEPWKIDQHLADLVALLGRLTRWQPLFLLLTSHAPDLGPKELSILLADAARLDAPSLLQAQRLTLARRDGQQLSSGVVARWPAREPVDVTDQR